MSDKSSRGASKAVVATASFVVRHAVASLSTVAAGCVIWTLTYAGLLAGAIVFNGGLGGPLAYPGGLVFVALAAAVGCLLVFFPATAVAEWICRARGYPILAQIPVTIAVLAALCAAIGLLASRYAIPFDLTAVAFTVWLFVFSLVPIGFYWWVVQAVPLLRSLITTLRTLRPTHS